MRGIGLCSMHYHRYWSHGELFGPKEIRAPDGVGHARKDGYVHLTIDGVRKYQHIWVAEKALGRELPKGARVHHINEDRSDNRPENLVICPNAKYHTLLHMRMNAVKAGCPPYFRFCSVCKGYDDPGKMYVTPSENRAAHRACLNKKNRENYERRKG